MYPREQLKEYIDMALDRDVANHVVTELMGELDQIPVRFEGDEISTEELPKYVEDNEIFTENPSYKQTANDFSIFDSSGNLILKVSPSGSMRGYGQLQFTVPLSHPDDKEALLDFCDRLMRNSAVKYPDIDSWEEIVWRIKR